MPDRRSLLLLVPAVLLVLCLIGSFATRGAMANLQFLKKSRTGSAGESIVDQRPLQTAQALSPLAISAEEQTFAHEAMRVADHEVDQAFAMALRQANTENRTLTGKALEEEQKVAPLQATVKDDQAAVDALTASAGGKTSGPATDDLDVAKAQLSLDTDELTDTRTNLATISGDRRGAIKEELAAHEAGMKKYDEHTDGGQIAVISTRRYGTLAGRIKGWFDQRGRMALLEQAQAQADADAAALTAEADTQKAKTAALAGTVQQVRTQAAPPVQPAAISAASGRLKLLRSLQAQRNILGIVNDRIDGQKELSAVYGKWLAQVRLQHRIVVHLLLQSFAWVAFVVLCAAAAAMLARKLVERQLVRRPSSDARSMYTLLTILHLVIQVLALLVVLLIIFGPPSQVPTILGFATAGVTVVFQDFILAFFGWFVLMGKNGIRVGDWVEIDGVGGEVVDIGLFRTALLETGNWTDKGHPTGRRTTFVNKFAVSGQYFNFSTAGQWMWDEIKMNIPVSDDTFALIERIHQTVLKETERDTALAETEWQRATQQRGVSQFSATPSVDLRPAAAGIDIVIRYVTRASTRVDVRNCLSQAIVDLMHQPATPAIEAGK